MQQKYVAKRVLSSDFECISCRLMSTRLCRMQDIHCYVVVGQLTDAARIQLIILYIKTQQNQTSSCDCPLLHFVHLQLLAPREGCCHLQ